MIAMALTFVKSLTFFYFNVGDHDEICTSVSHPIERAVGDNALAGMGVKILALTGEK